MHRAIRLAVMLGLLGYPVVGRAAIKVQPLVGDLHIVKVQKGDTLYKIARRNNQTISAIMQANHLISQHLKPGQTLILPNEFVLPRNPEDGIVLNIPERQVYLFEGGQLKAHYPCAVGKPNWQTVTGTYKIIQKKVNPTWQPTKNMVERADIKDDPVPPGKENPLGDRWMGWSAPGLGFHSTNEPRSVGTVASHGCVRLYPEAAHAMFDRVKVGETIYSTYEPVEVGTRDGRYYLVIYPDIYHEGLTTLAHVSKILQQYGLLSKVNPAILREIIANRDGIPHRIM
jgi:L,D-transpeptidase ErfK/SrfK